MIENKPATGPWRSVEEDVDADGLVLVQVNGTYLVAWAHGKWWNEERDKVICWAEIMTPEEKP